MMRPTVSIGPPAAKGTTIVTGRVGQVCAKAGGASAVRATKNNVRSKACRIAGLLLSGNHMQSSRLPSRHNLTASRSKLRQGVFR